MLFSLISVSFFLALSFSLARSLLKGTNRVRAQRNNNSRAEMLQPTPDDTFSSVVIFCSYSQFLCLAFEEYKKLVTLLFIFGNYRNNCVHCICHIRARKVEKIHYLIYTSCLRSSSLFPFLLAVCSGVFHITIRMELEVETNFLFYLSLSLPFIFSCFSFPFYLL